MATVENLFTLLDGDAEASTIIEAAKAAVVAAVTAASAEKIQLPQVVEKKREETHRANPPSHSRQRKHYNNDTNGQSNTNQQYSGAVTTGNANGYKGANRYKGNYSNADGQQHNNYSRYHADGGHEHYNNRRYRGGAVGYLGGGSRGAYHRNRNINRGDSDLQGNKGGVNGNQMDSRVDDVDNDGNVGWKIQASRRSHNRFNGYCSNKSRVATDNQYQIGDDNLKHVNNELHGAESIQSGNSYKGQDAKNNELNSSGGIEENSRKDEESNVGTEDLENAVAGENNGRVVENKEPVADTAEAANCSNENNGVVEGGKHSKGSKKAGNKKQDSSEKSDRKQDHDDSNLMTLKEYEKLQLEKRKALDYLQMTTEPRKVILEEDFESMQRVDKMAEDGISIKQNSEKDIPKKKDDEEKNCKSRITDRFLKQLFGPSVSTDESPRQAYGCGRGQSRDRTPSGDRGSNGERPSGGRGRRSFRGCGFNGERRSNGGRNNNGDRDYGTRHEGEKSGDNRLVDESKKPNGRGESRSYGARSTANGGNGHTSPTKDDDYATQFPALGRPVVKP